MYLHEHITIRIKANSPSMFQTLVILVIVFNLFFNAAALVCEYENDVRISFTVDEPISLFPKLLIKPLQINYPVIKMEFPLYLDDLFFIDVWSVKNTKDLQIFTTYVDVERKYNRDSVGQLLEIGIFNREIAYEIALNGRYKDMDYLDVTSKIYCPAYIKIENKKLKLIDLRQYLKIDTPHLNFVEMKWIKHISVGLSCSSLVFIILVYINANPYQIKRKFI